MGHPTNHDISSEGVVLYYTGSDFIIVVHDIHRAGNQVY
jgi:hypothetical protein